MALPVVRAAAGWDNAGDRPDGAGCMVRGVSSGSLKEIMIGEWALSGGVEKEDGIGATRIAGTTRMKKKVKIEQSRAGTK